MGLLEIKIFCRSLLNHCIKAVSPRDLVRSELSVFDNILKIRNLEFKLSRNCYVVGFGKAVLEMGIEVEKILHGHIQKGILSVPAGSFVKSYLSESTMFTVFEGAKNNIPDKNSHQAAFEIVELVKKLREHDILIVLISGGGSALLPYPKTPLTLDEKIAVTKLLSLSGANIQEMNCVRKHLSAIKGGKLAELAYPASVVTLILSDIICDPLDLIASGPTVLNHDKPDMALNVLKKYSLLSKISTNVMECIHQQPSPPNEIIFTNVNNFIIGSNKLALSSAEKFSKLRGYSSIIMTHCLEGSVDTIAHGYANLSAKICQLLSKTISKNDFLMSAELFNYLCLIDNAVNKLIDLLSSGNVDKLCLLFGGESTVEVKGSGQGGRNQELALKYSIEIEKYEKEMKGFHVVLLSAGTDGIDGPTDAAGALTYNGQTDLARAQQLRINSFTENNDSYSYFTKLNSGDDHIKIGHTGTNVMDIHVIIIERK